MTMKKRYSFIIAAAIAAVGCSSPSVADYTEYIDDCVRTELATINYIYDKSNGTIEENAILLGAVLNSLGYEAFAELGNTPVDYSYNLGPSVVKYHKELGMSYGDAIGLFRPYTTSPYKYSAGKLYTMYHDLDINIADVTQTGNNEWTFTENNSGVSFTFSISKDKELSFKADEASLDAYITQLQ